MTHGRTTPDSGSDDNDQAGEILKRVCKDLLALAVRKAPPGADPEDLTQETCLRFLEAIASGIEIDKEKAWCQQVLSNVCVDLCRRELQRPKRVEIEGLGAPQDASAHAALAYAVIGEFLPTLPSGQLRIFDQLLRGNSSTGIVQELQVSAPYVSKTLKIVRRKFEEFLNRRLTQHDSMAGDGTDRHPPRRK